MLIALMRSDPSVGNEIGFSLSGADWTSLNARLSARRGPVAETEMESVAGAFLGELGKRSFDLGLDLVPVFGQGKAVYEVATGKDIYGEDVGIVGRIGAGLSIIPGAAIIKRLASLSDAARGVAKGAGALDDAADAAKHLDDAVMEAPKVAGVGEAVTAVRPGALGLKDIIRNATGGTAAAAGKFFGWGPRVVTKSASEFTQQQLLEKGYTKEVLEKMVSIYDEVARTTANQSAAGRAQQLREIVESAF